MVVVILHKLYLQKHPEIVDPVFSIVQTTVNGVTTQQTVIAARDLAPPYRLRRLK